MLWMEGAASGDHRRKRGARDSNSSSGIGRAVHSGTAVFGAMENTDTPRRRRGVASDTGKKTHHRVKSTTTDGVQSVRGRGSGGEGDEKGQTKRNKRRSRLSSIGDVFNRLRHKESNDGGGGSNQAEESERHEHGQASSRQERRPSRRRSTSEINGRPANGETRRRRKSRQSLQEPPKTAKVVVKTGTRRDTKTRRRDKAPKAPRPRRRDILECSSSDGDASSSSSSTSSSDSSSANSGRFAPQHHEKPKRPSRTTYYRSASTSSTKTTALSSFSEHDEPVNLSSNVQALSLFKEKDESVNLTSKVQGQKNRATQNRATQTTKLSSDSSIENLLELHRIAPLMRNYDDSFLTTSAGTNDPPPDESGQQHANVFKKQISYLRQKVTNDAPPPARFSEANLRAVTAELESIKQTQEYVHDRASTLTRALTCASQSLDSSSVRTLGPDEMSVRTIGVGEMSVRTLGPDEASGNQNESSMMASLYLSDLELSAGISDG